MTQRGGRNAVAQTQKEFSYEEMDLIIGLLICFQKHVNN